jgi:hypothetical protein
MNKLLVPRAVEQRGFPEVASALFFPFGPDTSAEQTPAYEREAKPGGSLEGRELKRSIKEQTSIHAVPNR